jgi:hypothetical protein
LAVVVVVVVISSFVLFLLGDGCPAVVQFVYLFSIVVDVEMAVQPFLGLIY